MNEQPKTARSYRGSVVDDNAVISINIRWLGQLLALAGMLVYGFWTIESRIRNLEEGVELSKVEISVLLDKHRDEEASKREELEERVSFYEKEFNINPLSWGKRKKK